MVEDISRENSLTTSSTEETRKTNNFIGDPDCPICNGIGYVRRNVPTTHPDFGKAKLCHCAEQRYYQARRDQLFALSNLSAFSEKTFDTFNERGRMGLREDEIQSLQLALNSSMFYASNRTGWLLLMGGYGCGKTHLAAGIANEAVKNGIPTLFTTVPDLLDWLRFSYRKENEPFEVRFDRIRHIELLILDDLGTHNATEWATEKLYQILNFRYVNRKSTVITTNQKLEQMEGRIRSRLEDRDLVNHVQINAPDYRAPFVETANQLQLSTLNVHTKQTFESFSLREKDKLDADIKKNLRNAKQACEKFARSPKGWILLQGSYGCGKTHLAAAIANHRLTMGEVPMFVVVPDLLDHLRATFDPSSTVSYASLFNQVRTVSLLVLDDFGTQSATPWALEKLYQIFNYRYNAELPTVITTSLVFDNIDPRIRSRMLDSRICSIFAITAPAYRVPPSQQKK